MSGLIDNELRRGDPRSFWIKAPSRKPLLDIAGKPMIQHVYARASESKADRVLVATDDQKIADTVTGFGGECLMTR